MALKDLLKKREKVKEEQKTAPTPEFTFMRTTTTTQELITPPSFDGDNNPSSSSSSEKPPMLLPKTSLRSHFRNSSVSSTSSSTKSAVVKLPRVLNLRRHSTATGSSNVPSDLPTILDSGEKGGKDEQAKWEERATILAQGNRSRASTVSSTSYAASGATSGWQTIFDKQRAPQPVGGRNVSDEQGDVGPPSPQNIHPSSKKFPMVDVACMHGRRTSKRQSNFMKPEVTSAVFFSPWKRSGRM